MSLPSGSLDPRARLRLPAPTARLRLTLLYSGMFLLLGTGLTVIILVLGSTGSTVSVAVPSGSGGHAQAIISQQHSADVSRLITVSWLVLALTAVASGLFGWLASGRVLRPLRNMTSTARTISAGNLDQRLALTGPDDEFKRLGDTLDELLARLEASFEAQRRFVANASHELRTPLTLERTVLQVALADPNASAATLRAACEELLQSGREQERLLEALLTLASSERGLDRREPLDLAQLVERVLSTPRAELEEHAVGVKTTLARAPAGGDPALIERLIANLVDNAVRYNSPGGHVEIRTGVADGGAVLAVTNTGPVIAPEEVERLFEPFQRRADDRPAIDGHHGLGLSIVRAIATAHDATITASPRRDGGLVVTVSFVAA